MFPGLIQTQIGRKLSRLLRLAVVCRLEPIQMNLYAVKLFYASSSRSRDQTYGVSGRYRLNNLLTQADRFLTATWP